MITLSSAIQSLRDELAAAMANAATDDKGVRIIVEEAEVELQLTVTKEVKATGEVNVWLVKLGGGGGASSANSHRLKLKLKTSAPDGGPIDVGKEDRLPVAPPGVDR